MASDLEIKAKEAYIDDHFQLAAELYTQAIDHSRTRVRLHQRPECHLCHRRLSERNGRLQSPCSRLRQRSECHLWHRCLSGRNGRPKCVATLQLPDQGMDMLLRVGGNVLIVQRNLET